jgi:DNA-binding response OmpR family regulator
VLCGDGSQDRLTKLAEQLQEGGYNVLVAHSAHECVSMADEHGPDAIILDADLAWVDHEDIVGYLQRVSPAAKIVLSVEDPSTWRTRPVFVAAVIRRDNERAAVSILGELFRPSKGQ